MDELTKKVFRLSQDIGDLVGSIWSRWIRSQLSQLQRRLRLFLDQPSSSATVFPSLGSLLSFRLLAHIFSVTDHDHAIVHASIQFQSQLIMQAPVNTPMDLTRGIFVALNLADSTAEGGRFLPELASFLASALSLFVYDTSASPSVALGTVDREAFAWLRVHVSQSSASEHSSQLSWTDFQAPTADEKTAVAILRALYSLARVWAGRLESSSAFPEAMESVVFALQAVRPHEEPHAFPAPLQRLHADLLLHLMRESSRVRSSRPHLAWRMPTKEAMSSREPRFEVNYKLTKDRVSVTQAQTQLRQLKRQLVREKKAAMRELRRDADFIDQVRYQEQQATLQRQRQERWTNFTWLESQQAVLNVHVKRYGGELKGGGKNGVKPTKRKRN